ncbi:hypothetical protein FH972_024389 [Carpinus fangiana]|uniref:Uncharacterized protein n=1 Tax=Carpinus fangiana TaxID=176857 RepID=A0A5N6KY74_9ROSI|nr:hypothetical protein FH972_024389 [Carpinus fangiana]
MPCTPTADFKRTSMPARRSASPSPRAIRALMSAQISSRPRPATNTTYRSPGNAASYAAFSCASSSAWSASCACSPWLCALSTRRAPSRGCAPRMGSSVARSSAARSVSSDVLTAPMSAEYTVGAVRVAGVAAWNQVRPVAWRVGEGSKRRSRMWVRVGAFSGVRRVGRVEGWGSVGGGDMVGWCFFFLEGCWWCGYHRGFGVGWAVVGSEAELSFSLATFIDLELWRGRMDETMESEAGREALSNLASESAAFRVIWINERYPWEL